MSLSHPNAPETLPQKAQDPLTSLMARNTMVELISNHLEPYVMWILWRAGFQVQEVGTVGGLGFRV